MQVEHVSTLDRLKAMKDVATLAGDDFMVKNFDIAINDLEELKKSFNFNIMFFPRCTGKSGLGNAMKKITDSTFTCKEEKENVAS